MVVNFEFLGSEPIENVITCLNFQIDKVIFFGYTEMIRKMRTFTKRFLKKRCNVQRVKFVELPENNLQVMLNEMRREISAEKNNLRFFDMTGGESLMMAAFGMLSKEFETPMHIYDIQTDRLIELGADSENSISRKLPEKKIALTLEMQIEMRGGKINNVPHKDFKDTDDPEFNEDVKKIFRTALLHRKYWSKFSGFMKSRKPDDQLRVDINLRNAINSDGEPEECRSHIDGIFHNLVRDGILQDYVHDRDCYSFKYKNEDIWKCVSDAGSSLELVTCMQEKLIRKESKVGVHLDWDGVIHDECGKDVKNEIDVLSISGNIPVFISCKCGMMDGDKALHPLYELYTVARRFGGKYAKKVFVIMNEMGDVYLERAREMGIEVRYVDTY